MIQPNANGVHMKYKILAIDDKLSFLSFLKNNLINIGYNVTTIADSNNAIKEFKKNIYDCILLDVKIPGVNGLELLQISLKNNPSIPVIMLSGQSNIKIAVESIKLGAFDFIEKPIDVEKLHITIKNAIEKKTLSKQKDFLLSELNEKHRIIGESKKLKNIILKIESIADTPAKVLIQGETGTGKELVAWAIHHSSSRKSNPYIRINCAAIPPDLLESELFGYHKGSFTGASENKMGKFVAADGGTLFLDEIGDMSLNLQAKILRVLEENEVDIIGENKPIKINARIIAATNQNLEEKIMNGSFRKDLFYRLNVVNIVIPPLRERKDDITPLAYYFLRKFNETYNKQVFSITNEAENILINYDWAGNVRELRNVIEKSVLFSNTNTIKAIDIENSLFLKDNNNSKDFDMWKFATLKKAKLEFEKKFIISKLEKYNWNIAKVAEELKIDRSNLFKRIHALEIVKE